MTFTDTASYGSSPPCSRLTVECTRWRRPIGCAWSCRSFRGKEPLIIGLFCEKWPIKIRHPMGLCQPVVASDLLRESERKREKERERERERDTRVHARKYTHTHTHTHTRTCTHAHTHAHTHTHTHTHTLTCTHAQTHTHRNMTTQLTCSLNVTCTCKMTVQLTFEMFHQRDVSSDALTECKMLIWGGYGQ